MSLTKFACVSKYLMIPTLSREFNSSVLVSLLKVPVNFADGPFSLISFIFRDL